MSISVAALGKDTAGIISGLERLHGPVTVVRRCTELAELVAACQSGLAQVAIVAGDVGGLNGALADRLSIARAGLVVLCDDDGQRTRLQTLGISVVPLNVPAAELAVLIADTAMRARDGAERTKSGHTHATLGYSHLGLVGAAGSGPGSGRGADHVTVSDTEPKPGTSLGEDGHRASAPGVFGRVLAVWGPSGAPGRSTVAVNMAAELAAAGRRVLLIDADTYGASVATMLGLLDESAGLAQACRLADQGVLDGAAMQRISARVAINGYQLGVLTGITKPDRWPELRAAALAAVIGQCRQIAEVTVIDCGFCLEADEELSFDTSAPRRNAATLRSLELADTVYAVGSADAIGVPRLVRALTELEAAVPTAVAQVLLNKVCTASVGRGAQDQLRQGWERFGPDTPIAAFLPADPDGTDAALLSGSVLAEVAAGSPLRAAIMDLLELPPGLRGRGPRRAGRTTARF